MKLIRRGDVWQMHYTDAAGTRQRVSTGRTKKAEAQRIADAVAKKVLEEKVANSSPTRRKPITIADATARFIRAKEAEGKVYAKGLKAIRAKLLGIDGGERHSLPETMFLAHFNSGTLAELVTARLEEGVSPQTIAHEVGLVRATSRYMDEIGFTPADVTKWTLPRRTPKTRYLSVEEFTRLVDYLDPEKAPPHLRAGRREAHDLVIALTLTGARWGEIVGLRWGQLDPPHFTVARLWGSKTSQERVVPIPAMLREVLQRRFEAADPVELLVFPAVTGGERSGSCKPILRAMEALGFNDPVSVERHGRATVHSLRHTYASWLAQGGVPLLPLQNSLGHSTPAMTNRYAHLGGKSTLSMLSQVLDDMTQKLHKAPVGASE